MPRALIPIVAGLLGLAGALAATLSLHGAAVQALDRVLEERLRGAGDTAAELLGGAAPDPAALRATMAANGLEGAILLDRELRVMASATGQAGGRADLLRIDAERVARAFGDASSVAFSYALGDISVATGYFAVHDAEGGVRAVLALEAGQGFAAARTGLVRALWLAIGLSALVALVLALAARRFIAAEGQAAIAGAKAARGEAVARMGAMVAHEVRNPIGVIRGAVELVRARSGRRLEPDDREALDDVLGEVERLRALTEDFLDLAREPALALAEVDLAALSTEAALAAERAHPEVTVEVKAPPLPSAGDPVRLRQVLSNLLDNSAHAGARTIRLTVSSQEAGLARILVQDDGPGVDEGLRACLFDPFVSGRARGAGLGLAIARRIVERHGGTLELVSAGPPGAAFALTLPLAGPPEP